VELWQGKPKVLWEKTCHSATLHMYQTWDDLGSNLGLRGDRSWVAASGWHRFERGLFSDFVMRVGWDKAHYLLSRTKDSFVNLQDFNHTLQRSLPAVKFCKNTSSNCERPSAYNYTMPTFSYSKEQSPHSLTHYKTHRISSSCYFLKIHINIILQLLPGLHRGSIPSSFTAIHCPAIYRLTHY